MDISLLGPCIPFGMLEADSREMINTVQKMEMTIRTYTGGFMRYENDTYVGRKSLGNINIMDSFILLRKRR